MLKERKKYKFKRSTDETRNADFKLFVKSYAYQSLVSPLKKNVVVGEIQTE